MKRIRSGYGLGDNLYLQSIARAFIEQGQALSVCTDYPDVFRYLPVQIEPFTRQVDIVAHYTTGKARTDTTQFVDMCDRAGISVPELRIDWQITNHAITRRVVAAAEGRPIICVMMPRDPMGRDDGFGAELLPDCQVLQRVTADAFTVLVGAGEPRGRIDASLDLTNATSVSELLDVASIADGFIGYPSFFVPMAESFGKSALYVWAASGLQSERLFIRQITPEKLLHHPASYVVDDWPSERIDSVAREFRAAVIAQRSGAVLSA